MSEKFIIQGGKSLAGEIEVRGAKNSAAAILSACLLTKEPCLIENVPLIEDVFRILEIFKSLGVKTEFIGERALKIEAKNLNPELMDYKQVKKLRASVLLMGPLIARFAEFKIPYPGGCQIGARIIDPHLDVLKKLGTEIDFDQEFFYLKRKKLKGVKIVMPEMGVTPTENAVMAAVLAQGKTIIKCAASEHYIQDLCHFLRKMGAKISGIATHELIIEGKKQLKGAKHFIMPDPIETGTFLALLASTKSRGKIKNIAPEFLEFELLKFKEANVNFEIINEKSSKKGWGYKLADIKIEPSLQLRAVKKVHNMPYPGFAADLIQPFAVLMTQAEGTSLIHDWMFDGRLKYIDDLIKMGANAVVCDPHRVLITGPTPLKGTSISSFDLRAGASLIIAALTAYGQTEISDIYQVDRGYEKLEERLQKLGADIKRVKA
ncbi:MAG: UDP-N-acetylglucosamine 1-carboxyvinyltransferase [Parcubacteria group bacterium GW2011_GWA2_42_35]|nr:MAG: UDP-N-acetylglucosamine 1-carboxyvinyltransferase [Parcubacteria group bacterium GW2011_GWC2_42_13]KKS57053.1 MAG: UDP-N-acetylglucosamine 1-carboxyvinyltransferase [Parcubacteria group bacterium GW2011_GWA2_42_35]